MCKMLMKLTPNRHTVFCNDFFFFISPFFVIVVTQLHHDSFSYTHGRDERERRREEIGESERESVVMCVCEIERVKER